MPLVYAMHMHTAGGGVPSEEGAYSQQYQQVDTDLDREMPFK